MDNGSQQHTEPSLVSLLGSLANHAKHLLQQEAALIKLEAKYELHKVKNAAIRLSIGIAIIGCGGILLMLMTVRLLDAYTVVPLWGCYGIVAGVLMAVGGLLLLTPGKTPVEELQAVPQRLLEKEARNG